LLFPSLAAAADCQSVLGAVCPSLSPVDGGVLEGAECMEGSPENLFFPTDPRGIAPRALMSRCENSGALLHLLAWDAAGSGARDDDASVGTGVELLGVGNFEATGSRSADPQRAHGEVLARLSRGFAVSQSGGSPAWDRADAFRRRARLWAKVRLGWRVTASDLSFGRSSPTPYCLDGVDPPTDSGGDGGGEIRPHFLREVVLPHRPSDDVPSSLRGSRARDKRGRPIPRTCILGAVGTGPSPPFSTILRAVPAAGCDRKLSAPTLVFRREDADETAGVLEGPDGTLLDLFPVGRRGGRPGQLVVRHPALSGVDVRICASAFSEACFDETTEAMLAGSVKELQNNNVSPDGSEDRKTDKRVGNGDCWMEVREMARSRKMMAFDGGPTIVKSVSLHE